MCDSEYQQYVSHLPVKIHLTDKSETAMISSMRKVEVFSIQNIFDYERVLFLDGDIIVRLQLFKPYYTIYRNPCQKIQQNYRDGVITKQLSMGKISKNSKAFSLLTISAVVILKSLKIT